MAKKQKCPECPAGEKWAVPYADFLSLLLALFIALYAISASNTEKAKALKTEFIKIFDYAPRPEQAQPVLTIPPNPGEVTDVEDNEKQNSLAGAAVEKQSQESVAEIMQQGGVLEQIEDGIVLKLPTNLLFKPDSDTLEDQDSMLFLKRIVQIVHKLPPNVKIDIRGFANNPNIANTKYKSDYELAAARALNVMDQLIKDGVSPSNIFFSSQGQFGKPIQGNEEKQIQQGNRVEFYFFVRENQTQKVQELLKNIIKPQE